MRNQKIGNLFGKLGGIIVLLIVCLIFCCPPELRPDFIKKGLNAFVEKKVKKKTVDQSDYKVNLGLDLKGGSELLYEVNPQEIDPTRSEEDVISNTITIVSQRIEESKIVREPRVQRQGTNRILVQLPGLNKQDTNKIKKVIETLGNLEFRLIASSKVGPGIDEIKERLKFDKARKMGKKALADYEKDLLRKQYRWYPARKAQGLHRLVWVRDPYSISGTDFSSAKYDAAVQVVHFRLKNPGDFGTLTTKYTGEHLAIVFNNRAVAAPLIKSPIPDGSGVLENFSPDEAEDIQNIIRSGSLEIQPELLHENTIGPSLGEDSIRLGLKAGLIGLFLVIIFIGFYYMSAGVIAGIALMFNIVIVGAILVITRQTLTLPGIAGLILTVGMCIDANIIIFERIREEKQKRGKKKEDGSLDDSAITREHLLESVDEGYRQAFRAIFDANLTTLLTALILWMVATGAVQGFAFTMGVGILASFFTAIVVTRLLIVLGIELGLIKKLHMFQLIKNPTFDFALKMRTCAIISLVLIVIGMGVFTNRSERNYGLDLKGGILAHINLKTPLKTEEVRKRVTSVKDKSKDTDFSNAEVQSIITENHTGEDGWYEFAIRLPNQNETEIAKINSELTVVSNEMRLLRISSTMQNKLKVQSDEERRSFNRQIRVEKQKLIKNPGDKTIAANIKALREQRDEYRGQADEAAKEHKKFLKQIAEKRKKRTALIEKKNNLSGVEELRKIVSEKFVNELSPTAFPSLVKEKIKYRLKVNLQTAVSLSFLEKNTLNLGTYESSLKTLGGKKLLNEEKLGINNVSLATSSFHLQFKASKAVDNPEQEAPKLIKKHLELGRYKLKPKDIKITKDGDLFVSTILFEQPAPIKAVENAIEKCKFKESELSKDSYKVNSFDLLVNCSLAGNRTNDEMKKYFEEILRKKFATQEFEGKVVQFSDPFPRFTQISGVVAKAQRQSAALAIIFSLLVILVYIAVRFPGWRFGFGAVAALFHDVLITLGAIAVVSYFGLVNVEINLPIIAALLTIVGYSLNDTIVIFDRIRENQLKYEVWDRLSTKVVKGCYNNSLNQTLSRTILTSLTTFFVVGIIFFINRGRGSVMEGFSFALMVGIIVGTYSSIFVASSVVLKQECKGREQA